MPKHLDLGHMTYARHMQSWQVSIQYHPLTNLIIKIKNPTCYLYQFGHSCEYYFCVLEYDVTPNILTTYPSTETFTRSLPQVILTPFDTKSMFSH